MRALSRLLPLLLALAPRTWADVAVHQAQGRVDVAATTAPLADVLDHLARQTGMKIVYEGPAPRQLITLSLAGRSPAEAVTAILEGQGLNYALVLDETATRVEKLLVTSATSGALGAPRTSVARPARMQPVRPPVEEEPAEEVDQESVAVPPTPGGPEKPTGEANLPKPDTGQPSHPRPAPAPAGSAAPPAVVPLIPNPAYSSSPFNPKPLPLLPPPQPAPTPTPATTPP